jgi:hypothetical protein
MPGYTIVRCQDNMNLETERVGRGNKCGMLAALDEMRRANPYARLIFVQQTLHARRPGAPIRTRTLHNYTVSSFNPGEVGMTAGERRAAAAKLVMIDRKG